jgi:hypothetical protein
MSGIAGLNGYLYQIGCTCFVILENLIDKKDVDFTTTIEFSTDDNDKSLSKIDRFSIDLAIIPSIKNGKIQIHDIKSGSQLKVNKIAINLVNFRNRIAKQKKIDINQFDYYLISKNNSISSENSQNLLIIPRYICENITVSEGVFWTSLERDIKEKISFLLRNIFCLRNEFDLYNLDDTVYFSIKHLIETKIRKAMITDSSSRRIKFIELSVEELFKHPNSFCDVAKYDENYRNMPSHKVFDNLIKKLKGFYSIKSTKSINPLSAINDGSNYEDN